LHREPANPDERHLRERGLSLDLIERDGFRQRFDGLDAAGVVVRWNEMEPEPTEAEKAKGERAQWLLYAIMIVMVFAPLVIFLLRSR
jgi:hypothetical protein